MSKLNKILLFVNVTVVIVIVMVIIIVAIANAWTSPSANPPSGGGAIYYSGGNVGIGTTTPISPLTVVGAIRSTTGGFIFPDATTQTTAATSGTSFWTLSGTSLYPTSTSYNVGIGTTNPTSKLYVSGDANITGDIASIGVYNRTHGTSPYVRIDTSGLLGRDASSLKYKTNIRDLTRDLVEISKNLRPIIYNDISDPNGPDLIGFIAEEVDAIGLKPIVGYEKDGTPGWLNYDRLTAIFAVRIKDLETQIANLEGAVSIGNLGNVGIGTTGPTSKLQVIGLPEYTDNTTATAAGLTAGAFYRTGDILKVVH